MKKILSAVIMVLALTATTFAQFNSKVHFEQGGDQLTMESGGSLSMKSGSLIDMKAGSTLTVAGAATINISDTPTFDDVTITYGVGAATGVFSASVEAADLTATDDVEAGDDLRVTGLATVGETLTVTGASSLVGNVTAGAAMYKSTMTASNGNWAITGNVVSAAAVQGATVTGTTSVTSPLIISTGAFRLKSLAQAAIEALTPAKGDVYFCDDCTITAICVSSAAAVMSWVSAVNPATACN